MEWIRTDKGPPALEMKTAESFNVEKRTCYESNKSSEEGRAGECFAYLSFVKSFESKHFYYLKIWQKFTLKLCSRSFNKREQQNLHFLRIHLLGTDDHDDSRPWGRMDLLINFGILQCERLTLTPGTICHFSRKSRWLPSRRHSIENQKHRCLKWFLTW